MEHKYTFVSYFKYGFQLRLENGKVIQNEEQNPGDIYRLGIGMNGIAIEKEKDGRKFYLVEGYEFS